MIRRYRMLHSRPQLVQLAQRLVQLDAFPSYASRNRIEWILI